MDQKTPKLSEKGRFWLTHIENCYRDGGSVTSYLQKHNLKDSGFYFWKNRLQKHGALKRPATSTKVSFQKVSIRPEISPGAAEEIKIHFPNGLVLEWKGKIPEGRIVSLLSHWLK